MRFHLRRLSKAMASLRENYHPTERVLRIMMLKQINKTTPDAHSPLTRYKKWVEVYGIFSIRAK